MINKKCDKVSFMRDIYIISVGNYALARKEFIINHVGKKVAKEIDFKCDFEVPRATVR